MRILTASEQEKVSGGLVQHRTVSSPLLGGNPPLSPVAGLPPDNSWVHTPVFNGLGQVIGQSLNMGDGDTLITTTESDTFKTYFGNVDYTLMHEIGTSNNSASATQAIDGSNVSATVGYDTANGLFGGGSVTYDGNSASLELTQSGEFVGSDNFNVGGINFNASQNFSNGTFTLTGTGNTTDCSFQFDIFGLGSSGFGGGFGITCTGKPAIQPDVVLAEQAAHVLPDAHVGSNEQTAIA